LGSPTDPPDPLQKYRWWILGGSAVLLIGGICLALRRHSGTGALRRQKGSSSAPTPIKEKADCQTEFSILKERRVHGAARPTTKLMDGIKEELFKIEVQRKQGQISPAEYHKAKFALDQTLRRALEGEVQQA